ncbi:hypothetical protein KM043_004846 [Ampulex compressa]|nr:hypothetical protein KM043_004846 [Ampulex compressa]
MRSQRRGCKEGGKSDKNPWGKYKVECESGRCPDSSEQRWAGGFGRSESRYSAGVCPRWKVQWPGAAAASAIARRWRLISRCVRKLTAEALSSRKTAGASSGALGSIEESQAFDTMPSDLLEA